MDNKANVMIFQMFICYYSRDIKDINVYFPKVVKVCFIPIVIERSVQGTVPDTCIGYSHKNGFTEKSRILHRLCNIVHSA